MEKIITKAERRAVSALTKEVRRRDECRIPKIPRTKRLLKSWFIKEFWRKVYELTNREAAQDSVPLDLRSVSSSFADMCAGTCQVKETSAWVEIKFPNNTYWISCSDGMLYITPGNMDTFPIEMSEKRLVSMVEAFDAYFGNGKANIDLSFEKGLMKYQAQKRSEEILAMTARIFIQDIIGDEAINIEVRQQRNGKLSFTILSRGYWLANTVFETTFETLREDFIEAYKKFKDENSWLYYQ